MNPARPCPILTGHPEHGDCLGAPDTGPEPIDLTAAQMLDMGTIWLDAHRRGWWRTIDLDQVRSTLVDEPALADAWIDLVEGRRARAGL